MLITVPDEPEWPATPVDLFCADKFVALGFAGMRMDRLSARTKDGVTEDLTVDVGGFDKDDPLTVRTFKEHVVKKTISKIIFFYF
jgi:hypothetical protein